MFHCCILFVCVYELARCFKGDYLGLRDNSLALHTIYENGCEDVTFSDIYIDKLAGVFEKKRALAISNKAVYIMHSSKFTLIRKFRIADIKSVSVSRRQTDLLVLHHKSENGKAQYLLLLLLLLLLYRLYCIVLVSCFHTDCLTCLMMSFVCRSTHNLCKACRDHVSLAV
jgi:Unconventional myosin tail, actin- and lipid-binding